MNDKTISKSILSIQAEAEEKLHLLAKSYREKVLLPYCKKNGVTFYSGNGVFFFKKNGDYIYYSLNPDDKTKFRLSESISAALNVYVNAYVDFAQYIEEICEEDIKE